MALLLATALLAPLPGPAGALPGTDVPLEVRSKRTWSIELPADPFRTLSGEFPIPHAGGDGFAAEPRGLGLEIDTDGDGELDRVVEGREDPATKVRHARVVLEGTHADGSSFRYPVRLESRGGSWLWATSGIATGEVLGTSIEVIDMNGNGRFDDVGEDAIVVGGTGVAGFLGRTVSIDGELHELTVGAAGAAASVAPFTGATGTLDLHSAFGGKGVLVSAVVKSVDGRHSFEVSQSKDGMKVPTGSYYLATATLGLGDSRVTCDASEMKAFRVDADGSAKLAWGAPLAATFSYQLSGKELVLDPEKVTYTGQGGERWIGWNPIGKSPTFHVKDAETGDVLVDAVFPGSC